LGNLIKVKLLEERYRLYTQTDIGYTAPLVFVALNHQDKHNSKTTSTRESTTASFCQQHCVAGYTLGSRLFRYRLAARQGDQTGAYTVSRHVF